jgi:hypothetical protein
MYYETEVQTGPRAKRIADIVRQRQPMVERIERAQARLEGLEQALGALDTQRSSLLPLVPEPALADNLRALDIGSLLAQVASEKASLARLRARFARETINLGVVGRARMGKSRLLQSLSGLSGEEIPDGDGSHCTGVRSDIHHVPGIEPYADVFFYNEAEFLEDVIVPYFRTLGLGPGPRTIAAFERDAIPPLDDAAATAPDKSKYEHLHNYRARLSHYRELLGQRPRQVRIEDVRRYVAQDTVDYQPTFDYIAVRHVKVACEFPVHDLAQVVLIDMPGLGDTSLGHEERLIRTLGQDVDAVVTVKLPPVTGAFWGDDDEHLYEVARGSLTDIPFELWSFLVVNRTRAGLKTADNGRQCELLESQVRGKGLYTDVLVADCSDEQDVREAVLDRVVEHLADNIQALDRRFVAACHHRLETLQSTAALTLDHAEVALGRGSAVEGELRRFHELFDHVWHDLTNGLELLMRDLRLWREEPNEELRQHVDACLEAARLDTGVPSVEEIEALRRRHGALGTAYNESLHIVRTHLVRHFASLEDTLRLSLDSARGAVADVLQNEGRLGAAVEGSGTEFIWRLAELTPAEAPELRHALATLASVELTYRGFLQYRIRPHVMHLHPDGPPGGKPYQPQLTPEGIHGALVQLHAHVLAGLTKAFDNWVSEPNRVAEAIIEEFVDRVLRAESAQRHWRNVYLELRDQVWHEDFAQLGQHSRLRHAWDELVSDARLHAQPSAFAIQA